MTTRPAGDFLLEADIFGLGDFVRIGIIREASIALAAAVVELQKEMADADIRAILTHALATKIAGRCALENVQAETMAQTSLDGQLVMDWRVTIPTCGILRGLFVVKRLQSADPAARLFDLALRLAGYPEFDPGRPEI